MRGLSVVVMDHHMMDMMVIAPRMEAATGMEAATRMEASPSSPTATCTTAAQMLVAAAPGLLWYGPATLPVGEPCMTVIWELRVHGTTSCMNSLPGPVAIHLHVLPNHAEARVNTWWTRTFAAFTLLGTAPVLLLR